MYGRKYTDEEQKFMREYVPGHSYGEIATAFTEKFGREISVSQVRSYIGNHKLNTGRTGRFEKGHVPFNKGIKMSPEQYEKSRPTMFKKGHVPKNHKPVGSERINVDGYIEIKVEEPDEWKLKHRVIWESINGPIPSGGVIIFRDGNKTNTRPDNLLMITRGINAVINHTGMAAAVNEAKDAVVKIAELSMAISRKKKAGSKSGRRMEDK